MVISLPFRDGSRDGLWSVLEPSHQPLAVQQRRQLSSNGAVPWTTGTTSPLSPTPSPAQSVVRSVTHRPVTIAANWPPFKCEPVVILLQLPPEQQQERKQQQQRGLGDQLLASSNANSCVSVPLSVYTVMQSQNTHFDHLCTYHKLWGKADNLVPRA